MKQLQQIYISRHFIFNFSAKYLSFNYNNWYYQDIVTSLTVTCPEIT